MKIKELLFFLSKYRALAQLQHLPDKEYVEMLYSELSELHPLQVWQAIMNVARTESTYNRYPLLSEILNNMPDFSYERREIFTQAEELKKLKKEMVKPTHWFYEAQQKRIKYLSAKLTGITDRLPTDEEINAGVRKRLWEEIGRTLYEQSSDVQKEQIKAFAPSVVQMIEQKE